MNELLAGGNDVVWDQIAPELDAALGELDAADRDAVLLRYFQKRSAREMGEVLGVSEDAAQRRVSRAVERLRELFAKRGLKVGATGLAVIISSNSVHAAPIGLVTKITVASAALAGTSLATTATVTKAIAMTTLQKTCLTAALIAAFGSSFYEARQVAQTKKQLSTLERQQAPLIEQVRQLTRERDAAASQITLMREENEKLNRNTSELAKLRGEVGGLQAGQKQLKTMKSVGLDPNDLATQHYLEAKAKADQIARSLQQMPEKYIPELKLMTDVDWLAATKEAKFDTDADVRKTLQRVRDLAKNRLPMGTSLFSYTRDNNGQLPTDVNQLKPYIRSSLNNTNVSDADLDAILGRYKILRTGNVNDLPQGAWVIVEQAPVDRDYDSRAKFGNGTSTIISTGLDEAGDPDDRNY